MGAITNMRPELFRAIVSHVPFVDVMNTMLDASLPLTVPEYEEWGDPNQESYFKYMLSYSPYDNLRKASYPAMLVKTSLHDSQVMYWEPAKYVAKLRTLKADNNPLLLVTNMQAGHGGSSGRYDYLKEIALDYAFLLRELGSCLTNCNSVRHFSEGKNSMETSLDGTFSQSPLPRFDSAASHSRATTANQKRNQSPAPPVRDTPLKTLRT